jgi:hypothetical protein
MACFLAPAAEAIVVTVIRKRVQKKEEAANKAGTQVKSYTENVILWSRKLGWLNNMLWGGVFLLAIEHIWHGEVVPWPPFLTAMSNPADIHPMLMEILTVGGGMVVFVTIVWYLGTRIIERRVQNAQVKRAGQGA